MPPSKKAHTDLSSAFFRHLWTPFSFRSFSLQSNHLNFGLPSFLLQSGFPRNTFLTVLSSGILTRQPAHSGILIVIVSIWFSLHNQQFIISLDSPAILIFYLATYLLNIFHSHVLRNNFICLITPCVSRPRSSFTIFDFHKNVHTGFFDLMHSYMVTPHFLDDELKKIFIL